MNALLERFRALRGLGPPAPQITKRLTTKPKACLVFAYKVLTWEDVSLTLTVFTAIQFLFWFVVQFEVRPLGLIALVTLAGIVADWYMEDRQPIEVEVRYLEAVEKLESSFIDYLLYITTLRKENPSSFVAVAFVVMFLVIAFGRVPLALATFLIVFMLMVFSGAYAFYHLLFPDEDDPPRRPQLNNRSEGDSSDSSCEEIAVFEVVEVRVEVPERDPNLDRLLTNESTAPNPTTVSVDLEDLPPIPSHWDVDNRRRPSNSSGTTTEDDELIPINTERISLSSGLLSSTSSESDGEVHSMNSMRFDSQHFNGESSSDDDIRPSEEMPGVAQTSESTGNLNKDIITQRVADIVTAATTSRIFTDIVDEVVKKAVGPSEDQRRSTSRSDSDSDFEVIEYHEFD